jgi:hypothetical protein
MLLFRSEEHLDAWRGRRGIAAGATLTLDQQWELARIWYADRTAPDWRRRTPEEAEAVFASLGLTGDFWRLTSPHG